MTIIVTETRQTDKPVQAPYYRRLIRCPGHWLVSPKVDVYLRKPVALLKNCSDVVEFLGRKIKIKKTTIVRDKWGNKVIDWKKLYALRKTGEVLNPPISASEAIERIYDPKSPLCMLCDKRCMEGKGTINEFTIKRLHG